MTRLSRNSSYSIPTDIAAIERLLSELEPRLERLNNMASRTSSEIAGAAGRAQDAIADTLGDLAGKLGKRARTTGDDAAKLGKELLGKAVEEVEYRPIATLLVALGIGLLLGMGITARR